MFAVEIRLLTGCYVASAFNNRQEHEWPIHPHRVFSAMVASWAQAGQDAGERGALTWLESQSAPSITCSSLTHIDRRQVVTHFVPGNDAAAFRDVHDIGAKISQAARTVVPGHDGVSISSQRALHTLQSKAVEVTRRVTAPTAASESVMWKTLELLPAHRNKQARYYPCVRPSSPIVTFTWPETPTVEVAASLDEVLQRVGRIGHSSSLVSARVLDPFDRRHDVGSKGEHGTEHVENSTAKPVTYEPLVNEARLSSVRSRVPGVRTLAPDLLDALVDAFGRHGGIEPRTLPATFTAYGVHGEEVPALPNLRSAGDWLILELRDTAQRSITRTLELTRTLRAAVMSHAEDPLPTLLSGHAGGAPAATDHVMWLALPNVGSPHSSGQLGALAIALPQECDEEEREQVFRAVARFQASGAKLRWRTSATGLGPAREERVDQGGRGTWGDRVTTSRRFWARVSQTWTTATPIALDRFPRALRAKSVRTAALESDAAKIISESCVRNGLPEPADVALVLGSPLIGVPPVGGSGVGRGVRFPGYQAGAGGAPRYAVHARVSFDSPVRGPVVLGAGRHFGYGLMLPTGPSAVAGASDD